MKKKWLTIGIILLFVGVTIVPVINFTVVKASLDNDPIEVTAQACGVKGYGDITVKLTRGHYQKLEDYLFEFRTRLNQTTTKEEAVPLFKEAIMELNKYGLLPKGISVAQALNLVTERSHNMKINQVIRETLKNKKLNDSTNILCLIAGYSTNTEIVTLFQMVLLFGYFQILHYLVNLLLPIYLIIAMILVDINMVFFALDYLLPLVVWSHIYIHGGNCSLYSIGLGGRKKWFGNFGGYISGFTGFKILLDLKTPIKFFYIGSALWVEIS